MIDRFGEIIYIMARDFSWSACLAEKETEMVTLHVTCNFNIKQSYLFTAHLLLSGHNPPVIQIVTRVSAIISKSNNQGGRPIPGDYFRRTKMQ